MDTPLRCGAERPSGRAPADVVRRARSDETCIDVGAGDGHVLVEVVGVADVASRSALTGLHLVCPPGGPAARVLRLLDMDDRWPVHHTRPPAVAVLGSRG